MSEFIRLHLDVGALKARQLQKHYYVKYGTTLNGLMTEHGVNPEDFLHHVHDIDLTSVVPNDSLRANIAALPGRRYVFTNGSTQHAENVMGKLGITELFDDIFDIRAAEFTPKPHRETYEKFIARHVVRPREAAMFEDLAHNLEAAHALGMTTVLVCSGADWFEDEPEHKRPARPEDNHGDHVHYATDDLSAFLGRVQTSERAARK
jgi:putative hydrolase of the HAD superfamily